MIQKSKDASKAEAQRPRQLSKQSPRASIVSRNTAAAAVAADSRAKLGGTAAGPEEGGASSTSSIGILTVPILTTLSNAGGSKGGAKGKGAKKIDVLPTQVQFDCFKRDGGDDDDSAKDTGRESADINAPKAAKPAGAGDVELGENKRYNEFPRVDFAYFYEDGSKDKEGFGPDDDAAAYEGIFSKVSERNEFFLDETVLQSQALLLEEGSGSIGAGLSIGSGVRSPASGGSPRLSFGNASEKRRSRVGSSPFALSGSAKAGEGATMRAGAGAGLMDDAAVPRTFDVPINLYGCKREELGAALVGDRAQDDRMLQIGVATKKIAKDKLDHHFIKVLVCGDPTANKGSWLVKLLGYGVLRNPTSNVLSRRIWHNDALYYVEFKLSNSYSAAETERDVAWANAFVLLWDVESRASYDAIPQLHQDITHQKNKPSLPMVVVMGNSNNVEESAWNVSRAEGDFLQDMLSLPSLNGTTTEEVVSSLNRLIDEFAGYKANIQQQQHKNKADSFLGTIKRPQTSLSTGGIGFSGVGSGADAAGIDMSKVKGELEFVVLGDAFVGKTAFMKRVSERTFVKPYNATATKIIRKKNVELTNGDVYSIKIIDTPGFFVEKSYTEGADVASTSSASSSSISYSSANAEAEAASSKIGSPVTRGAATSAVNWLKQESLLQSQAFIAMFSMTSYQSFEYACDLIDHIQTARMEIPDSKAPIVFLVGNKSDLAALRAVDPKDIHSAAARLGCSYSIISCKDVENGRVLESLNRIVDECNIIGKAQVQEQARKPTLELYSKQGYLLYGKEKRKCKTKMFFYVHDGVLQYGSNEKDLETLQLVGKTIIDTEAPPNIGASQILGGGASSNNTGTEANIHITVGPTNLWVLAQPEVEKLSWEAAVKLNMIKGKMQDSAAAAGGAGAAAAQGAGSDQQFSAEDRHTHRSLFKTHHKKKE